MDLSCRSPTVCLRYLPAACCVVQGAAGKTAGSMAALKTARCPFSARNNRKISWGGTTGARARLLRGQCHWRPAHALHCHTPPAGSPNHQPWTETKGSDTDARLTWSSSLPSSSIRVHYPSVHLSLPRFASFLLLFLPPRLCARNRQQPANNCLCSQQHIRTEPKLQTRATSALRFLRNPGFTHRPRRASRANKKQASSCPSSQSTRALPTGWPLSTPSLPYIGPSGDLTTEPIRLAAALYSCCAGFCSLGFALPHRQLPTASPPDTIAAVLVPGLASTPTPSLSELPSCSLRCIRVF